LSLGRLTPLQERLLVVLAGMEPPWTLSGGGALAGFYTAHRDTRDLDLFWQHRRDLGDIVETVVRRLEAAGLETTVLLDRLTAALGWPPERADAVVRFRETLVERIVQQARPEK
jgi:hypothetical protein